MDMDSEKIRLEYEVLKGHRACLEDMISELDCKINELLFVAEKNKGKLPVTVRTCRGSVARYRKQRDALQVSLVLADKELLHLMDLLI